MVYKFLISNVITLSSLMCKHTTVISRVGRDAIGDARVPSSALMEQEEITGRHGENYGDSWE